MISDWVWPPPPIRDRPWTVCFYGCRGGAGRSTLAINTAILLAGEKYGRGVSLLDFDLETPGFSEFPPLAADAGQLGFVEYVGQRVGRGGALADLKELLYRGHLQRYEWVYQSGTRVLCDRGPAQSRFWLVGAGRRDRDYRRFLASFEWSRFYEESEGWNLLENVRAGIRQERDSDVLLVDCPSGQSESVDVCIEHLADAVVIVFQPTRTVGVRETLAETVRSVKEREKRENRSIPRLYVASNFPEYFEYGDGQGREWTELKENARGIAEFCEGRSPPLVEYSVNPASPAALEPWPAEVPWLFFIHCRDDVWYEGDPAHFFVGEHSPAAEADDPSYEAVAEALEALNPIAKSGAESAE